MVPLSAVMKKEFMVGPYSLTRFNMYPAITINGQARPGVSSGQAMAEMEAISDRVLPKDMGYNWSGSSLQEQESSGQIGPILSKLRIPPDFSCQMAPNLVYLPLSLSL